MVRKELISMLNASNIKEGLEISETFTLTLVEEVEASRIFFRNFLAEAISGKEGTKASIISNNSINSKSLRKPRAFSKTPMSTFSRWQGSRDSFEGRKSGLFTFLKTMRQERNKNPSSLSLLKSMLGSFVWLRLIVLRKRPYAKMNSKSFRLLKR